MSPNNIHDWTWLSLFGPGNASSIPSIEGDFPEDYEVDEEYIEGDIINIDEDEDEATTEEESESILIHYDDDEED
jgi:hypothetical protein